MPILLLRCPCCGGRAKQSTYYNVAVDSPLNEDEISIVRCTKCSLRILSGTGKKHAAKQWNKRTPQWIERRTGLCRK
jgi:hypothetical protein